jgi:pimeloyl-ACP methyl ester carboxylesterase
MPSSNNLPKDLKPANNSLLYFETHEQSSNSEWLLLVHGAGGSTRTWKRQLEELGAEYNLLIIDLPGHGQNANNSDQYPKYSFLFMAEKIWEVIDHLEIHKIHLIGVSLGTIICFQMRHLHPDRVLSVIMPGAIVQLNRKLKVLASSSLAMAKVVGYRRFYNLTAKVMLPRKNHKKSRDVFIRESQAITLAEFKKWTVLYYDLNKILLEFFSTPSPIPHLLIMGSQDHLFLKPAKAYAREHDSALLKVIPKCGHVVSIEKAQKFNGICLKFLAGVS